MPEPACCVPDAGVHPHLATVTYLCGGGAPTVVLPVASPVDAAAVPDACCRAVRSAHACWPRPGRHLAFDGRMLHGAPLGLAARKATVPLVVALAVALAVALGPRAALEARVGLGPRVMRCA